MDGGNTISIKLKQCDPRCMVTIVSEQSFARFSVGLVGDGVNPCNVVNCSELKLLITITL